MRYQLYLVKHSTKDLYMILDTQERLGSMLMLEIEFISVKSVYFFNPITESTLPNENYILLGDADNYKELKCLTPHLFI